MIVRQIDRRACRIEQLHQPSIRSALHVPNDQQPHRALDAPRTMFAWVTRALIHICAACVVCIPTHTLALELSVRNIGKTAAVCTAREAVPTMLAWRSLAFIYVDSAIDSCPTWCTGTRVAGDQICARRTVLARICDAVVCVRRAAASRPADSACAREAVNTVNTAAAVAAWVRLTFVNVGLAVLTFKASGASARVVVAAAGRRAYT